MIRSQSSIGKAGIVFGGGPSWWASFAAATSALSVSRGHCQILRCSMQRSPYLFHSLTFATSVYVVAFGGIGGVCGPQTS